MVAVFPVLGETAAAVEPGEGSFDDPTAWQNLEAFGCIGAFDDFDLELRQDFRQRCLKLRPLIAAIGKQLAKQREPAKQRRHHQQPAITILNVSRMNHGVQQQPNGVDEDMALLAFDLFAGIEPMRINAGPPFSALFTLWLSMMQAVGLASRSACSRHLT